MVSSVFVVTFLTSFSFLDTLFVLLVPSCSFRFNGKAGDRTFTPQSHPPGPELRRGSPRSLRTDLILSMDCSFTRGLEFLLAIIPIFHYLEVKYGLVSFPKN